MIAIRIGPDVRMAAVGSLVLRKAAEAQGAQDLVGQLCINHRLPTLGGVYAGSSKRRKLRVKVDAAHLQQRCLAVQVASSGFAWRWFPSFTPRRC
jgi:hypothetical protein